jgi:replication factor A1
MIKIPYEQIVERIKNEANISEDEIHERINTKMKQLSGLISKEGAAHIVANELGIKLLDAFSGKLQIKNIVAGMRNVETVGKVLQVYELREFKTNERQGKVASFIIGDETGTVRAVMWGDQADNIKSLESDMTVKILGGYVRDNNGVIELHLNDRSKLIMNPEGEVVKSVRRQAATAERKSIGQLTEKDSSVEILGTIVQAFDPRFFEVCPQCSKRVKNVEGSFICDAHDKVEPDYSYVMNLIIDDGTENIRTVFFRESMEQLTSLNKEKILELRINPAGFEKIKTDLLGNIIKINGRIKKNIFFDRLELVANNVSLNPDPDEEIKRLNEEAEKAESN